MVSAPDDAELPVKSIMRRICVPVIFAGIVTRWKDKMPFCTVQFDAKLKRYDIKLMRSLAAACAVIVAPFTPKLMLLLFDSTTWLPVAFVVPAEMLRT